MHVVHQPVTPKGEFRIPENELSFSYSSSRGPGGQNVNKRETRVRLQFDVLKSNVLNLEQKTAVLRYPPLSHLVHQSGIISITSQRHTTQGQNKKESVELLHKLLSEALQPQNVRIPGGKPPNQSYPPSEHRRRELRRANQKLNLALNSDD